MPHGETYIPLSQIVTGIRTGVTFKRSIDNEPDGDLSVILPRDIVDGTLVSLPPCIYSKKINPLGFHLLKSGDILIGNKGTRFGTFLYQDFPRKAIATSSFFVITANEGLCLPQYLYWHLNQPSAKGYLSNKTFGSTVPSLTKGTISGLPLPLIPLAKQEWLIRFIEETRKEEDLMKKLLEKTKAYYDAYIWEQINM